MSISCQIKWLCILSTNGYARKTQFSVSSTDRIIEILTVYLHFDNQAVWKNDVMNPESVRIHVAAAAIVDDQHRVLLSKRPVHVHQGGLWEFPGGKLEEGETLEEGLRRELLEELGITPMQARPLIRIAHDYPDKSVLLDVWRVDRINGVPRGLEGQRIQWVPIDQLQSYRFPAANLPVIKAVDLPECYLITPEPGRETARFLVELERSLELGVSLLQLRARQLPDNDYRALIPEVLLRCQQANARLLLNTDPRLVSEFGAAGVHLSSERLMASTVRPLNNTYLVAASCHTQEELQHAVKLGLDFVVVSPVRTTSSHPGARTLGFSGFHDFTERASIPVYALGGMQVVDLPIAFRHGGQGIAAIRGLWNQTLTVQIGR